MGTLDRQSQCVCASDSAICAPARQKFEQLRAALAVHERAAAAAAARGGDDEEVGVFGGGELVGAVDV